MTMPADAARPDEPRRWRRWALCALVVVAVYGVVAGVLLWSARSEVLAGRDALTALAAVDPLTADLDQLANDLAEAGEPVNAGANKLRSPLLWPLRPVPVVGRHLATVRGLSTVVDDVVAQTTVVVVQAAELQRADETARVPALAALETSLRTLNKTLEDPDLGPSNNLIGSVHDARVDADRHLADLRREAGQAEIVIAGLRSFLESSSYLTVAANINEMQVGSGTPLSLGTVRLNDGDFTVTSFETIQDVEIEQGIPSVDDDVASLWGFLSPTNDFKKLMLTPRFNAFGGPQSLVLYESTTGDVLEGTLVLDPIALQALLRVVGPVTVDEQEFTAETVLRYIFVDQYDEFLTGEEVDLSNLSTLGEGQLARRDRLAGIAAATVEALATRAWEPLDVIAAFRPVAAGRHLLAYSADPVEQAMWESLGVAGEVDGDEFGVALLNIGANKLDPFVDVDVTVEERPTAETGVRDLEISVTITNNASPTLPLGVTGYYWEVLDLPSPPSYLGRLMFLLPSGTSSLELADSDRRIEVFGRDGPLAVMVARLDPIREGTSLEIKANAVIDTGPLETLEILPSARYIAIDYDWNGQIFTDAVANTVTLVSE